MESTIGFCTSALFRTYFVANVYVFVCVVTVYLCVCFCCGWRRSGIG